MAGEPFPTRKDSNSLLPPRETVHPPASIGATFQQRKIKRVSEPLFFSDGPATFIHRPLSRAPKNGGFRLSRAPLWRVAAGSAAKSSHKSLVSSRFSTLPPQRTRFAAPGRGAIVCPCLGSCAPLRCRCSPGAEGTESPILTTRPRSTRQFCTLGHLDTASAFHSGRQAPMPRSGRTSGCSVV
jgi:hypothetical protein